MRCAIGRLRDEERAGDLVGRQAAEEPQRERHPRLGGQHRMAGGEHEPQQIVADVVVAGGLERGVRHRLLDPEVATDLAGLRSSLVLRRNWSIARRLAVAISHAPGFRGMPVAGHCSSAATSASCASSSASPTSRTMRASPAMSFADSIRQTASIASRVSIIREPVASTTWRISRSTVSS